MAAVPHANVAAKAPDLVRRPTPLKHPSPDLQSLQGAYSRNIAKLERSAEEMSNSGSDLGHEIRRLSRQSSVQSSHNGDISGAARNGAVERVGSTRSTRSSSYGVNASTARWGGYSPTGNVTSPGGSGSGSWSHASLSRVQSGSKSSRLAHVTEPTQEGRPLDSPLRPSFSIDEEDQVEESAADRAKEHVRDASQSSFAKRYDEIAGQIEQSLEHVPPSPEKAMAQLHREQALQHLEVGGTATPPERPRSTDTYREAQIAFKDFDGVHFSPETDEFVEIDEAGNEIRRVSARSTSGGLSHAAASMLRTAHDRPISMAPPPPQEDMVYYPAPVPRMLNLPKRLSQLPAANVQAKRRSQVLGTVPRDVKDGAPWLSQNVLGENGAVHRRGHSSGGSGSSGGVSRGFLNERMSANLNNLPPQLRANMFFEHQPVQHDVQVKSESAVATLDSILAASATAPVHAFTDHPFAGDVRSSVYATERTARKSTATVASGSSPEQKKPKKRRSSSIGALLRRTTSSDAITDTIKKRNSRASMLTEFNEGAAKLRKRQSTLSLGTQLETEGGPVQTPVLERRQSEVQSGLIAAAQNASPRDPDDRRVSRAPTVMSSGYRLDDADQIEADFVAEEAREDVEEGEDEDEAEPIFVQPSTLLAELQVRKAQLKSRNKTAATAFPRGMHSTLLELDAVEEISKRKRQQQRIALAWEDPHQRALEADLDANDENVPLGMLFPGKDGVNARKAVGDGRDFERPLGLMERRAMEDSEPLSSRRTRLMGISPAMVRGLGVRGSQMNLAGDAEEREEEEDGDEAGETLGQRLRRMKTKAELDGALADIVPEGEAKAGSRPVSALVDDVMSQFGGLVVKDKDKEGETEEGADANVGSSSPAPPPDEDETLGQRRARLQREREASGSDQRNTSDGAPAPTRPPLYSSNSLANLLSANPIGARQTSKSHEPAHGSLLHNNDRLQARHKSQLASTNMRSSSFNALDGRPLVDPATQQGNLHEPNAGGLLSGGGHMSRAATGGFGGGMFNNGMGGIVPMSPQQQQQQSPLMGGMMGGGGFFASPTAAMGNGYAGMAAYGQSPGMAAYVNPYFAPQPRGTVYQPQQPMMMMMGGYGQQQQMNPLAYHTLIGGGQQQGGGNAFMPQTMGGGTYASFAQNGGFGAYGGGGGLMNAGMGMGTMGVDEEGLNAHQRSAIDRWRMGIGGQ